MPKYVGSSFIGRCGIVTVGIVGRVWNDLYVCGGRDDLSASLSFPLSLRGVREVVMDMRRFSRSLWTAAPSTFSSPESSEEEASAIAVDSLRDDFLGLSGRGSRCDTMGRSFLVLALLTVPRTALPEFSSTSTTYAGRGTFSLPLMMAIDDGVRACASGFHDTDPRRGSVGPLIVVFMSLICLGNSVSCRCVYVVCLWWCVVGW